MHKAVSAARIARYCDHIAALVLGLAMVVYKLQIDVLTAEPTSQIEGLMQAETCQFSLNDCGIRPQTQNCIQRL